MLERRKMPWGHGLHHMWLDYEKNLYCLCLKCFSREHRTERADSRTLIPERRSESADAKPWVRARIPERETETMDSRTWSQERGFQTADLRTRVSRAPSRKHRLQNADSSTRIPNRGISWLWSFTTWMNSWLRHKEPLFYLFIVMFAGAAKPGASLRWFSHILASATQFITSTYNDRCMFNIYMTSFSYMFMYLFTKSFYSLPDLTVFHHITVTLQ